MRDPHLDDGPSFSSELDDHLGGEEGATRFDSEPLEHLTPEELGGAIDIGDLEPEEDAVGQSIGARVGDPHGWVGALDPEADDGVGMVGNDEALRQPCEVGDAELAVPVGEGDVLEARRAEPGPQGRPVPQVGRMVNGPDDIRTGRRQFVGDPWRLVAGPASNVYRILGPVQNPA